MVLSAQQVQEFHDNGVVLAENVVTDGDLQPVIDELRAWIDQRARQLHSEGKIKQLHEDKPFENRLYYLAEQYPQFNEGLDIINIRGRGMFEFLLNDHLLDAVEQLLGTPEITCNPIQHIRSKMYNPQQSGGSTGNFPDVPWHQDAGVTWDEADESLILTCWIAMTDATRENGCMEVIPGVARGGYLDHTPDGGTQIRSELLPDRAPICAEVNKGGAVFMSQFTPHRGLQNTTPGNVRWSLDLRYQETGTPTGRPFHPEFVARSADPSKVMRDYDRWREMWEQATASPHGRPAHRPAKRAADAAGR